MSEVAVALALVAVALGVSLHQRLSLERDLIVATVRALVQLSLVAAAIGLIFSNAGLIGVFLAVMLGAASVTSGRRLAGIKLARWLAAAAISGASAVAFAVLFGARVFPMEPQFIVPIAGMLIGNCMTATSLAGARLRDELTDKVAEVEARLALGVPAGDALRPYARRAAVNALIPTIDSTKNVGLIFLPGAFVGMMLAGRSPYQAAQVQLVVLFMLLGAVALAAMVITKLVARSFMAPGERLVIPSQDGDAVR